MAGLPGCCGEAMIGVDSVHVAGSRELCLRSLFLKRRERDWESEFLDSLLALPDHFSPIILSLFYFPYFIFLQSLSLCRKIFLNTERAVCGGSRVGRGKERGCLIVECLPMCMCVCCTHEYTCVSS